MLEREEKKVEYLELIYDLIFVYIIGRNNSLLQQIQDGFVPWAVFFGYIIGTLAIIQIWSFSTFYINLFGRNSVRDHVFLFINMYLLYHMADGIGHDWQASVFRYCAAWALILVNIGVQYLIELRNHRGEPWAAMQIRIKVFIVFGEAALVLANLAVYHYTQTDIAYVPILFGIIATVATGILSMPIPVDFAHLSERAMLYVVFTFGEMIIVISSYFTGGVTAGGIYFSLMAFLIVAGLFLSYELVYNRLIDRSYITDGVGYMLLHVFLIFALSIISVALEFMREEEVELLPKTLLLTGAFLLYFVFLFFLNVYAKRRPRLSGRTVVRSLLFALSFSVLMLAIRHLMYVSITITVIYVFAVFLILYRRAAELRAEEGAVK